MLAVEVDGALTARLARRFADHPSVTVFGCDALEFPLPASRYRVVANPPFNRTSAILHRLLDQPEGGLAQRRSRRAVAGRPRPRRRGRPRSHRPGRRVLGTLVDVPATRRLPATLFRPAPSVDAAILSVTRRRTPLLPVAVAAGYREFVRIRFGQTRPTSADDWIRRFAEEVERRGER